MTELELRVTQLEKKMEELEKRLKAIEIALSWGLYEFKQRKD